MIALKALPFHTAKASKNHTNEGDRTPEVLRRQIGYIGTDDTHVCLKPYQRLSRFLFGIVRFIAPKKDIKTIGLAIALRNRGAVQ
jgi:hypothetical protein